MLAVLAYRHPDSLSQVSLAARSQRFAHTRTHGVSRKPGGAHVWIESHESHNSLAFLSIWETRVVLRSAQKRIERFLLLLFWKAAIKHAP
jgi:hypothetical protein